MIRYFEASVFFFSESNSTERMKEIRIHSNNLTSVSTCTLNELQPPELSHILRRDVTRLDYLNSSKFPMTDVFECVSPENTGSTRSESRLLTIFGMFNLIRFRLIQNLSSASKDEFNM